MDSCDSGHSRRDGDVTWDVGERRVTRTPEGTFEWLHMRRITGSKVKEGIHHRKQRDSGVGS
jgi:hypothetical protein